MNLNILKKIIESHKEASSMLKRNLIKEYFQILSLYFIYSNKDYQSLIFYGGSCLRHCFDLPRLSEDLDFIDLGRVNTERLTEDLIAFFEKNFDITIKAKTQKYRIYLKFPILHKLTVTNKSESDFLIIKIEIFNKFDFCKNYKIEIIPIFKFGKSFLVKTLDLSSLMSTKIRAIFLRKWEKTDKAGRLLAKVKGRDYFDLLWYLKKGIKPNLKCLNGETKKERLKEKLLLSVKKIDRRSLTYDLESLIEDRNFVKGLGENMKEILIGEISNKL